MQVCTSRQHEDIAFSVAGCPLCDTIEVLNTVREEYKNLQVDYKHLEGERDDLAYRLHTLETDLRESVRLARQLDAQEQHYSIE